MTPPSKKEQDPEKTTDNPLSEYLRTGRLVFNGIQKKYDGLIEKGKRKIGFYKPDVTEKDRFLMSFLIYFTILLMVVFIADYAAQLVYEDSDSLHSLQETEAELIYRTQKDVFDMPVYINDTTLWYDTTEEWRGHKMSREESIGGFGLEVDSVCTGFHEMVFLSVLILGFRGVPVKLRIKWMIILDIIIFIENLFRIFALYPMAIYWGRDFEEWFHHYWWHIGQYLFIMSLFGLWFIFVANKYIGESMKSDASENEKKGKAENSGTRGDGKNEDSGDEKNEDNLDSNNKNADSTDSGDEKNEDNLDSKNKNKNADSTDSVDGKNEDNSDSSNKNKNADSTDSGDRDNADKTGSEDNGEVGTSDKKNIENGNSNRGNKVEKMESGDRKNSE